MNAKEKMVIFNIGWMKRYEGPNDDEIHSTAKFIDKNKWGYELFNFLPFEGHMYGFVQPSGTKEFTERIIRVERIGTLDQNTSSVDNVLTIWVAPKPGGGTYVVGWYKNARVYKHYQSAPTGSKREYGGNIIGYYAKAKAGDCVLLPLTERKLRVPKATRDNKGGLGQSCVWFADKGRLNELAFRKDLLRFIESYEQRGIVPNEVYEVNRNETTLPEEIPISEKFQEGTVQKRLLDVYERNPKARRECIAHYGARCQICEFDFYKKYGEIGKGLIHVHHLKPLSEVRRGYEVDPIRDLLPVCPNCHAVLHNRTPPFTVEEIKHNLR